MTPPCPAFRSRWGTIFPSSKFSHPLIKDAPWGFKARELSTDDGTAEAVPCQTEFSRRRDQYQNMNPSKTSLRNFFSCDYLHLRHAQRGKTYTPQIFATITVETYSHQGK
jgi:hypothetical protein